MNLPSLVSERCINYIKSVEKLISPARHLLADADYVVTGGYGETSKALVHEGMKVSEELANHWLAARITAICASVNHICAPLPLTQGQFDALVSFAYNEGATRLAESSILIYMRRGDLQRAADAFLLYDIANGKRLTGLDTRRNLERSWFLDHTPQTLWRWQLDSV